MARQRFIHPELWSNPTVGQLTPVERLFFVGWFSNADDEGSFYQIDGLEYLAFKKWSQYQKLKYPSLPSFQHQKKPLVEMK